MLSDSWLLIAENSGNDGNGQVLGYICPDSESDSDYFESRRGELHDNLNMFDVEDISDNEIDADVATYYKFAKYYDYRFCKKRHKAPRQFVSSVDFSPN